MRLSICQALDRDKYESLIFHLLLFVRPTVSALLTGLPVASLCIITMTKCHRIQITRKLMFKNIGKTEKPPVTETFHTNTI